MTLLRTRHSSHETNSKRRDQRSMRRRNARKKTTIPFNFKLWFRSKWETVTMSMFFSPLLSIMGSILLGLFMTYVDYFLIENNIEPPIYLSTNVASARSILSTIAGATISFSGTAFSVSLLVIQLGSSQYSPRIVHTLFKDPFNRRIVAVVMGTFTYCLVVMRSIGNPSGSSDGDEEVGPGVVPNLSVVVAFVLGVISLLAIVAFIDHSASTMDISQLLERVTRDTMVHIRRTWKEDDGEDEEEDLDLREAESISQQGNVQTGSKQHIEVELESTKSCSESKTEEMEDELEDESEGKNKDDGKKTKGQTAQGEDANMEKMDDCYVVRFRRSGWVQEIDMDMLLRLVPPGGYIQLHTLAGRYACPGSAACSVYPRPTKATRSIRRNSFSYGNKKEATDDQLDEEDEEEMLEEFDLDVLDTVMIGASRTIRTDATYGLRQLVDVVLRALSPGVNDPTTAQDGIFHVAAVVTEFLQRVPPPLVMTAENGGKLYRNEQQGYDRIVRLAFEEVRVCAASSPMVGLYVLEALRLIRESLQAAGRPRRAPEIERQARLLEENIRNASHIKEDYEFIARARRDRFDTDITSEPMGSRGQLLA